jgi:ubiquinone/menaquinone biosynthesis C-methylase UbiE
MTMLTLSDKTRDDVVSNRNAHNSVATVYNETHTEIYNPIEQHRLSSLVSKVVKIADSVKPLNVLDVGAGTGNLTRHFLDQNCKVVAMDVSEKSLEVLQDAMPSSSLTTMVYDGKLFPFQDMTFDVVACYSVLHHIDDYMSTVREMSRVCKRGGLILIDHEAGGEHWHPTQQLNEWRKHTRLTLYERFTTLYSTKQLLTVAMLKTVLMKMFVNRRYQREGDIHVWADDHIQWDAIHCELDRMGVEVVEHHTYLLYKVKGAGLYEKYSRVCTDTAYGMYKKV